MAEAAVTPQRGIASLLRGIVIAGAMAVAACVRPTAPPPAPVRPGPAPVRPAPGPVNPGLPDDAQRHRVALLVPLTGGNAGVGRSLANATQLAILDTKAEDVRITTYDTANGAAAAAQRALADGNKLILGPLLAEDARAVAPIARRAGVPVLSFSNDTSVAGNGTYLMGYNPAQSIERVVDHARRSGVTSFAGLMPTGLYGERASTAFLRAVEGAGGTVTALETYNRGPAAMNAAIARLARSPFQAVLIADSASGAVTAIPGLRRANPGARVLGPELWNSTSGIGGMTQLNGAWFASVSDTLYRTYAAKYRARFGAAPYRLSTLGYDAVLLTVRIARDWRPGDVFPIDRLGDRGGFGGLDGAFRFGRDGIAERALEVQEIRGGTTVTVSPAPSGFGR
ncbi:penicillin-binding protein activator [Sphingomonas turrisvirgatae]|uniref:ABC transporter substrate-binding protein n=1 Tax=Sphingomonas turrisvirgatae TaxID=1888892 RepID=A0A1E3LVD5_9SPHN|nr:penicillin-binding protein activator [Sphingomonas turrisvirgatae]ODP37679.1 ABC transporter substrate-binding protein [Sphingomonas turrisvirgatae]